MRYLIHRDRFSNQKGKFAPWPFASRRRPATITAVNKHISRCGLWTPRGDARINIFIISLHVGFTYSRALYRTVARSGATAVSNLILYWGLAPLRPTTRILIGRKSSLSSLQQCKISSMCAVAMNILNHKNDDFGGGKWRNFILNIALGFISSFWQFLDA